MVEGVSTAAEPTVGRLVVGERRAAADVAWQGRTVHTGVWKTSGRRPADGAAAQHRRRRAGRPRRPRRASTAPCSSTSSTPTATGRSSSAATTSTLRAVRRELHRRRPGRRRGVHRRPVPDRRGRCSRSPSRASPATGSGIRMGEPRMPGAAGRAPTGPGSTCASCTKARSRPATRSSRSAPARRRMTVAEIDALLYLPGHDRDRLRRALRIPALSPGWQASFRALLDSRRPATRATPGSRRPQPAARLAGFRPLRGDRRRPRERHASISLRLAPTDGDAAAGRPARPVPHAAPAPRAGGPAAAPQLLAVGPPDAARTGSASSASRTASAAATCTPRSRAGDQLEVAAPRGTFVLRPGDGPVLLVSAGIGATPVLAMLHALAEPGSTRRDLVAARRPQRRRARLRRPRSRTCSPGCRTRTARLLQRPGADGRARPRLRRRAAGSTAAVLARSGPAAGRRRVPLRAGRVHGPTSPPRWPSSGVDAGPHPHRGLRRAARPSTPGIAGGRRSPAASTGRAAGHRTAGVVRAQRPDRAAGPTTRQPARARRGLRRADPLVVPHRRLPHLRDRPAGREVGYEPEPIDEPADGNVLICCAAPVQTSSWTCDQRPGRRIGVERSRCARQPDRELSPAFNRFVLAVDRTAARSFATRERAR